MILFITRLGRNVTYHEGVPPIRSQDPWISWFCISLDKLKQLFLHYYNAYGHKICQNGYLLKRFLLIKSHDHIIMWSCEITWQTKVITYPLPYYLLLPSSTEWVHKMRSFPSWNLKHPLITWSWKFTWQIKYVIYPLPQWLWLPNLPGWFYIMNSSLRWNHKIPW